MHKEMDKPDLTDVCKIERDLLEALNTVISHGIFSKNVNKEELGGLVDMVKDMAETKRNCWEAHYYEKVCHAMDEAEDGEYGSAGYNPNRYANGRYAPKGHGNMTSGYTTPDMNRMPPIYFDEYRDGMYDRGVLPHYPSMGYSDGRDMSKGLRDAQNDTSVKYGRAYKEYEDARRHYTETKSPEDKNRMDDKAMEHVDHSLMTLREIWKGADSSLRKEMKASLMELVQEMPT